MLLGAMDPAPDGAWGGGGRRGYFAGSYGSPSRMTA